VQSSATPELLDFLGRQGIPLDVFRTARKPMSEAHNRQETPLFAKSIERRASNKGGRAIMGSVNFDKTSTAPLGIDPYNDFISEGGKIWSRLQAVADANHCVSHMLQALDAARTAGLLVFYALHRRYRPGDYETWKYLAPIQKRAWSRKTFEYGTWGGEIRSEF